MNKKDSEKLFANLPVSAAGYIRLVIRKMGYRRKVRQDVQAELIAHFEDELSSCQSDKEKEEKAQKVIAEFGDAKLIAILARRAKKRCRPMWRTAVVRCFQFVLVVIAIYATWYLTGSPSQSSKYTDLFNSIIKPAADESLNAAAEYEKAAKLVEDKELHGGEQTNLKIDRDRKKAREKINKIISGSNMNRLSEMNKEDMELLKTWLAETEPAFDLIREGNRKPYYWRKLTHTNTMKDMILYYLHEYRQLSHGFIWKAHLAAEQGDFETAIENLKTVYILGSHLASRTLIIEQIVGMGHKTLAARAALNILNYKTLAASTLTKWQNDFEQLYKKDNFTINVEPQRFLTKEMIERAFTDDAVVGGHIYWPSIAKYGLFGADEYFGKSRLQPLFFTLAFKQPTKRATLELCDKYFDFVKTMIAKTPYQSKSENLTGKTVGLVEDNPFLKDTSIVFSIRTASESRMRSESLICILAIFRYKDDKGAWPQNMEDLLSAGYIKQIPLDAYSDKPLIYKATEDNFMLYSIGADFTDNGGIFGKYSPTVSKPIRTTDFAWDNDTDLIFWPVIN